VSFGLLKIEATVALLAGDFGGVTVILYNGFDGVKGIMTTRT
jgi:hypothetical protein